MSYASTMRPQHRKKVRHFEDSRDFHELTFSCYRRRPLLTNDPWRRILARSIDDSASAESFCLIAFVFMPEHVHLLVLPNSDGFKVSRFLARLKQPTSSQTKQILVENGSPLVDQLTVRERPGKTCFRFWQEGPGFDRNIVSAAALSASIDYIHMNPVKRGLCEKAIDWKWSSARFHADGTIDPDLPQLTRVDPLWFDESGTQISHS